MKKNRRAKQLLSSNVMKEMDPQTRRMTVIITPEAVTLPGISIARRNGNVVGEHDGVVLIDNVGTYDAEVGASYELRWEFTANRGGGMGIEIRYPEPSEFETLKDPALSFPPSHTEIEEQTEYDQRVAGIAWFPTEGKPEGIL